MFIVKSFLLSIVIGLIAYEISKFFLDGALQLPVTTPEISLALIFVATAFASLLLGGKASAGQSSVLGGDRLGSAMLGGDRESGTVKWFNVRKGYGFITRDAGDDIFVHFRNIEGKGRKTIEEGQRVSFVVTDGDKGLQADQVTPA